MLDLKTSADGLAFWVLVQPRASKKAVGGLHQDALKIKLTAPPVEGAANEQCIEVLAKALDRPKSTLTIVNGQTNRRKQILVRAKSGALSPDEVKALQRRLMALAETTK
ncbi:MAG: YggU family protein [Desulfobacterales bacterium]|nr:YggU family protein [Desulfobacterales bacterium]